MLKLKKKNQKIEKKALSKRHGRPGDSTHKNWTILANPSPSPGSGFLICK